MTAAAIFAFYFGWPEGAVWSNLLASLICAILVWWRLRARMIRQHLEQLAQRERHHEELKAHVTKTVTAPVIQQMSDEEFEQQLQALMRRNPAVLDAFMRSAARRHGRPDWPTRAASR